MRLVVEDGKIEFGGETLIEHINFDISSNDKVAIIGKNGCGKTSLLKVIEGELDLTFDNSNIDGYINKSNDFTLGYLKQISFYFHSNPQHHHLVHFVGNPKQEKAYLVLRP